MKWLLTSILCFLSFSVLHANYATETIAQVNAIREKAGLGDLAGDPDLNSIAQEWANKLAGQHSLVHRSRGDLMNYLQKYGWHGMNENLHCSTSPATPAFVIQCWMNSPVHHENLMRPKINKAGIGVKDGDDGLTYVVFNGAF